MNPISQIELKAHYADLHRQVAVARLSQRTALERLATLWGKCAGVWRGASKDGNIARLIAP
jgi:hypothetical protein